MDNHHPGQWSTSYGTARDSRLPLSLCPSGRMPPRWRPSNLTRATLVSTLALWLGACAGPEPVNDGPLPQTRAAHKAYESDDLSIGLLGSIDSGTEGSLARDPGWREYRIEVRNQSTRSLTLRDVKLLNSEGRYLASAMTYEELSAPPDTAEKVAADVARRSAGIAAGQFVPYGGTVVGVISTALTASKSESEAEAKRTFIIRRMKNVELAPGGRMSGSAFLPQITDAQALVIDYGVGNRNERIELSLGKR